MIAFFGIDARTEVRIVAGLYIFFLIVSAYSKTSQLSRNLRDNLQSVTERA